MTILRRADAYAAALRVACAALLCLPMLTGCETWRAGSRAPLVAPAGPWEERSRALTTMETYALSGRIAVAAAEQGFSGALRFEQKVRQSQLQLDGPLGVGGLRLEWNGDTLRMLTSRGEELDGEAARAAIEARLGFALPLDELRYWLLGVPAPATPADLTVNGDNRLSGLQQSGWRVVYTEYGATSGMPQKLTAQKESARVRVIVDQWLQ
jgi:outer membrane lipoprotein LolB